MTSMVIHGSIVRLEPDYGFGFLRDEHDGDWFFVADGVRSRRLDEIWIGASVGFRMEQTPRGPRATDIHLESDE